MSKLKRAAAKEFAKLSPKEQRRINKLRRIPTAGPGHIHDRKSPPRKKKWTEDD